ncbi:alpha/beta fold hydrolase [Agromyces sp. MMS17-SY077]|uniref:Alpha/beta fold hydrolase n=1 Tax=Agromyces seonyuensis TaxID=2662446 RepID=A0A6I4P6W0_9MICO|nr:alpha/beta fold hydrolase [Agromyces seonyuensis]
MAGIATAAAAALGAVGFVIARKVTAPVGSRRFDLVVREVDDSGERPIVVIDRTAQTVTPGRFNLILYDGAWVQLGETVVDRGMLVGREIVGEPGSESLKPGVRASWSGMYFETPADAGLDGVGVAVRTEGGLAPAWLIEPTRGQSDAWAIHIHGLGGTRAGMLRGVQVAADAGLPSLVVTYRNDSEGPEAGWKRSTLGATEADDVDAAIRYALEQGARRVILFGWSMGGAIALELATRAGALGHVAGLVLESPVLDWVETIKENCARAGLPRWVGGLAVPWLDSPTLARLLGLPAAVDTARFDWIDRAHELQVPTLVLHGTRDTSVPFALTTKFAAGVPAAVRVEDFDADHTMTWNADPDRWRAIVADWIAGLE